MPPLMQRPNPITLAILSLGALIPVAQADDQTRQSPQSCGRFTAAACSCPAPRIPSLLPQTTPPAAKQKPKGEKDISSGGDIDIDAAHSSVDVTTNTAIFTGNVVIRQGDREIKADQVQVEIGRASCRERV